VAGNIGAKSLFTAAAKIEAALKADADQKVVGALLERLQTALAQVIDGLEQRGGRAEQEIAADVDSCDVISRMRALLADYNGDAVDLMPELAAALAQVGVDVRLAALKQQISAYDFDAALAELEVIAAICSE
jgi:polar amino acid transport system substrate-binding protein